MKKSRVTLQIVKIAGREQDGILENWNDEVLGVGYWILDAGCSIVKGRTEPLLN